MILSTLIYLQISIHASAKEATKGTFICASIIKNFNPRLREGGDEYLDGVCVVTVDFNPRLREGGDLVWKSCR